MKYLHILPLLLCLILATAQKCNAANSDTSEIKKLEKIVARYQFKNPAKAIATANEALSLAFKTNNGKAIERLYERLGRIYNGQQNFKTGFKYYNLQLNVAKKRRDSAEMVGALINIAMALELKANYVDAMELLFSALSVSEGAKKHPNLGLIYVDIGAIYSNENNNPKAMAYINKVFSLGNKVDTTALEKAYELMGVINSNGQKYAEAKKWMTKALKLYQQKNDSVGQAIIYTELASCYGSSYGDDKASLQYCLMAKAIWDIVHPITYYSILNMANISSNYWEMALAIDTVKGLKNKKALKATLVAKADQWFNSTLAYSRAASSKSTTLFVLDSLSSVDAYEGKYKDAFNNMKYHEKLNDSVFSQKDKNVISDIESSREIAIRNNQLQINKLQIAVEHKQILIVTGGFILLLCIAGLIYYQNQQRKKANTTLLQLNNQLKTANSQLDEANKVKIKFFSILNHDLRSPIANYLNFLRLQRDAPDLINQHASEIFADRAEEVAENLLHKMDDLLLWSKGQMENFKPEPGPVTVSSLFAYIGKSVISPNVTITFEQQADLVIETDENYLITIMHNLTNNAIKALANMPGSAIGWKAWEDKGIKYLSITDNGPGAPQDQFTALYTNEAPIGIKNGLGLHIVRDMAKAIDCKVVVEAKPGVGVTIVLEFV